ncbi:MAG: dihydroorotate dehydrogenase electron transfer subunit [Alistipes sp.]|jgi:dihydroorotate dehydrogenase electron transfer subunit|nr:dihydroorotate dehydrogenase electron transfer subunit [Alistipes sp.]
MQRVVLTVAKNVALTPLIYEMTLVGDVSGVTRAGQFVEIALDGLYLRRPISVCNYEEGQLTLVYKVVGKGTDLMSQMAEGTELDVLTGLGNGFDVEYECQKPLLVGGGVGVPPLYRLTRDLIARGREVSVVLGFNTESEIFYAEEFEKLGAKVILATADGSVGVKGFVTDAIRESGVEYDYFYSCGPLPMLKALCSATTTSGEVSLEERMGCGFGICMGCSIMTANGAKRVCKDGPVFKKEEVIW